MKVAYYSGNDNVRVEDAPIPAINSGEVLVKMRASGICGSDLVWEYRKAKVEESIKKTGRGIVLGHEIAGEIAESRADGWKKGDRVVVAHHVPCGACTYCSRGYETSCELLRSTNVDPGGYAELIRVPAVNVEKGLFRLPDNLSFIDGSFVEPLGCAVRAQRKLDLRSDDSLAIIGCGVSGLLHLKLAVCRGLTRIYAVDVDRFRLGCASTLIGANYAVEPHDFKAKVNKIIVCAGNQDAVRLAVGNLDRGGMILYFAVPDPGANLPLSVGLLRDEILFMHSYGAAPTDMREALDMLSGHRIVISDLVTHRLPLERIQEGFNLAQKRQNSLKVIIEP